jgi:hypothetical protein
MIVYLLSILDGVSGFLTGVVVTSLIAVFVLGLFTPLMGEVWRDADAAQVRSTAFSWAKRGIAAAVVAGLLGALTPTTETLLRAYVMVEGSKLVNAPNAQKAADEILKRVDALIGKVGSKHGGSEQSERGGEGDNP